MGLVMDVARRLVRMHHGALGVIGIEMKHARLVVIDPDHGMKMLTQGLLLILLLASESARGAWRAAPAIAARAHRCDRAARAPAAAPGYQGRNPRSGDAHGVRRSARRRRIAVPGCQHRLARSPRC